MNYRNFVVVALLATLMSGCGEGKVKEVNAPYGLQWGQSMDELREKGMELLDWQGVKRCEGYTDVIIHRQCITQSPPDPISFAKKYTLEFRKGKGLHRVITTSKKFRMPEAPPYPKEVYVLSLLSH